MTQKKMATINPYKIAAGLILLRMKWDLHPYSWVSRRKLNKWRNRFFGQKAVIICNGPSLNRVDFKELKRYQVFTFGLNKINLLFSRTEFRPSVIVAVNPYVIEQNSDFFNKTDLPIFIDSRSKKIIRFRKNVHFLHSCSIYDRFAMDCKISINEGFTVTYVALQLAFHMGFYEVALIGCDHFFNIKGTPNKLVYSVEKDFDHFDTNYFCGKEKWQLPDIVGSELHYRKAKEIYEKHGRKIFNCTDGGKLEIFERLPQNDFLKTYNFIKY